MCGRRSMCARTCVSGKCGWVCVCECVCVGGGPMIQIMLALASGSSSVSRFSHSVPMIDSYLHHQASTVGVRCSRAD
jgi:hypothetical protein